MWKKARRLSPESVATEPEGVDSPVAATVAKSPSGQTNSSMCGRRHRLTVTQQPRLHQIPGARHARLAARRGCSSASTSSRRPCTILRRPPCLRL